MGLKKCHKIRIPYSLIAAAGCEKRDLSTFEPSANCHWSDLAYFRDGVRSKRSVSHFSSLRVPSENPGFILSAFRVDLKVGRGAIYDHETISEVLINIPLTWKLLKNQGVFHGPVDLLAFSPNNEFMKPDILVADDDKLDRHLLKTALQANGYSVSEVGSGRDAMRKTRENLPSLLILDLNLGDFSGLDVCAALKNDDHVSHIPIIVLTGDDETGKNIACLDQGADDYMTKPFDGPELLARVRAILRRVNYGGKRQEILKVDGLSIDVGRRAVFLKDRAIESLTPKEFDLFYLIAKNSPNLVDRRTVAKKVWNSDVEIINERTIDVHIRRIRLKLGPALLGRLRTVPGKGYKLI